MAQDYNIISKAQIDNIKEVDTTKDLVGVCVQVKNDGLYEKVKATPNDRPVIYSKNLSTTGAVAEHVFDENAHLTALTHVENLSDVHKNPYTGENVFNNIYEIKISRTIVMKYALDEITKISLKAHVWSGTVYPEVPVYMMLRYWAGSQKKIIVSSSPMVLTNQGWYEWEFNTFSLSDLTTDTDLFVHFFNTNNSSFLDAHGAEQGVYIQEHSVALPLDTITGRAEIAQFWEGIWCIEDGEQKTYSRTACVFDVYNKSFIKKHIEDKSIHFSGEEKCVLNKVSSTETTTTISAGASPNKVDMVLGDDGSLLVRAGGEEKDVFGYQSKTQKHIESGEEHIYNDIRTTDDLSEAGCHNTLMMRVSPSSFGLLNHDGVRKIAIKAANTQTVGVTSYLWVQGNNGVTHGKSNGSYIIEDGWYVWEFDTPMDLSQETSYIALHFRKDLTTPLGDWPDSSNTESLNIVYDSHGTSQGIQPDRMWYWSDEEKTSVSYSTFRPKIRIFTDGYMKRHVDNAEVHISNEQKEKIDNAVTPSDIEDVVREEEFTAHTGDETKHLSAAQTTTLSNLAGATGIDVDVSKDSTNLITSGAVYSDNEFLYGEVFKNTATEQTDGTFGVFSYKVADDAILPEGKVNRISLNIQDTSSKSIRLLVMGINDGSKGVTGRFHLDNLSFVGLSSNSVNTSSATNVEFVFDSFAVPSSKEFLIAFVEADESATVFADKKLHDIGVEASTTPNVSKIIIPTSVMVSPCDYCYSWNTPWSISALNVDSNTGRSEIPMQFGFVPHKENTDIHLNEQQKNLMEKADDVRLNGISDADVPSTTGAGCKYVVIVPNGFGGGKVKVKSIKMKCRNNSPSSDSYLRVYQGDADSYSSYVQSSTMAFFTTNGYYEWSFEPFYIDTSKWIKFESVGDDLQVGTHLQIAVHNVGDDNILTGSYCVGSGSLPNYVPYIELRTDGNVSSPEVKTMRVMTQVQYNSFLNKGIIDQDTFYIII